MKTKEYLEVEAHCEELQRALDEIAAILRSTHLTMPDARRRISQILVQVRKPD